MANVVSILVQAKDRAKPVFKDVSGAAEKAVSNVADSSRGIIGRAASAARSIFSNVVGGLTDMGDAIVNKVGGALKIGLAGVGAAAGAALFGGINRLLNIEDATHSLKQMGLTGKQTRGLMDSLVTTMQGMTFTLDTGALAIQRLITSGAPLDDVIRRFKLMADAAAFGKAPLEEVTGIFERIQAEGKLTGETLNMLQVRGIPALSLLASAAGKTEEEFRSLLSEGEIGAEEFFDLWEEGAKGFGDSNIKMEGAAKSMEQTTRGAWRNMLTAFSRVGATIAGPIFSKMRDVFIGITEHIEAVEPAIQRFADRFSDAAEGIIRTKVIPAFQRLGEIFRDVIIPAFQEIIKWVKDNEEQIKKWLKAVLPAIGIVAALATAMSLVKDAFILLTRFTPIGIITALVAAFIFAWQNSERFREIVTDAFDRVKEAAKGVWEFIKSNLLPIWMMLGEFLIQTLIPAVGSFLGSALEPLWNFLKDKLVPMWMEGVRVVRESVLPTLLEWWSFIAEVILPILGDLISSGLEPVTRWWGVLSDIVKNVVLPAIGAAYNFFRENILPVLRRVGEFIRDEVVPAFIEFKESVFEHIITPLQEAWAEFKEKYLPVIKEAAEETREKLIEAWKEIKKIWNEHLKPALEELWTTFQEDVLPAMRDLWKEIDGPLMTALKLLGGILAGALFVVILGFLKLLGNFAEGIGVVARAVRTLLRWWNRLRSAASRIVKRVTIPGGTAIRRLIQKILDLWNTLRRIGGIVLNVSAPGLSGLLDNLSKIPSWVPGFASGGIGSGLAIVGERGRELVDLGGSSRVFNKEETDQILSGGGKSQKLALEVDWRPGFEGRITDAIMNNLLFRIRTSTELQDALKLTGGNG